MAIGIRSALNTIGQEGCTSLPVMILNIRHNFKVSLLLDRLGMLSKSRSVT